MKFFNLKKIVIALLVSSMIISLASCFGRDKTDDSNDAADETTVDSVVETYLDIVTDGVCVDIVYGATALSSDINIADMVANQIGRLTSAKTTVKSEKAYNADKVEIVVGKTSYPESQELIAELGYGQCLIKVIGNKLVIVGNDSSSMESAVGELSRHLQSSLDENKNIKIATSYSLDVSANEVVAMLPVLSSYTPDLVDTGDGCYMLNFNGKTTFDKYIALLEKSGFTVYAKNTIDGNEYTTYVSDELVVNALYTKWNKKCKLLVQKLEDTGLPTKAADNKYTPVSGLKSSITQVGLFYNVQTDEYGCMTNFNGMNYIIRLADGSFIIVDGGHEDIQADHIYDTLKVQAPDPNNIVIAAWFFSHNHGDHIGFFRDFCAQYGKMVTVESFVYNFPSKDQGGHGGAVHDTVDSCINGFFPNAKKIKAHPGQEFNIRNAKITMLYTLDVYEDALTDTNNASIVWQMELEGKTFMCFGDYSENSKHLLNLYTSATLKSDIVQIAHHGISGQNGSIYPVIDPEYAFWPVGAWYVKFHSNGNMPALQLNEKNFNQYFFTEMDTDKVYLAADDFVVMTIDDGTVEVDIYADDKDFLANYTK